MTNGPRNWNEEKQLCEWWLCGNQGANITALLLGKGGVVVMRELGGMKEGNR